MSRFFARNIGRRGRVVRGLGGMALLGGSLFCLAEWPWLAALLGMAGIFSLFQALRGWCLARACGLKTKF